MTYDQSAPAPQFQPRNGLQVSEYIQGKRRYYHAQMGINVVKIFAGDCQVSDREDEIMATILGSCVSACIRDPDIHIGGMNHFLLPGDARTTEKTGEAARYGVCAMEGLINRILKAGGRKDRLEIKVFGGGNVLHNSARIGSMNSQFIREFLRNEGLRIAAEDLEGELPRSVHYYPVTGKVMIRYLHRQEDLVIMEEEARYLKETFRKPIEGDIELFS
jgi:chemotaxis protein CheD